MTTTDRQLVIADAKIQGRLRAEAYYASNGFRLQRGKPYDPAEQADCGEPTISCDDVIENSAEDSFANLDCDESHLPAYVKAYASSAFAWKPGR